MENEHSTTYKARVGKTQMIAHRGASLLERENTCAAFVAAGNRTYYGIETDVHKTSDGNFIIIHDGNTSRVGGDNINVEETTFETLRKVQLFSKHDRKDRADLHLPSLEEYVSICRQYQKIGVLELKSDFTDEEIAEIIRRIEELNYLDSIIFISFGYENLKKVRKFRPNQTCQYLFCEWKEAILNQLIEDRIDLDIVHNALSEENIRFAHEHGLKVNCWTLDNPERAELLASYGVDFITSNMLEAE